MRNMPQLPFFRSLPGIALVVGGLAVCATTAHAEESRAIQKDPLAWLKSGLSCSDLTDQFKARYAPLGPFSGLPEEKKAEVRAALDIICSPLYEHCSFGGCKKLVSGEVAPKASKEPAESGNGGAQGSEVGDRPNVRAQEVGEPAPEDLLSLANEQLQRLVADRAHAREKEIKSAEKGEMSGKRAWERIVIEEEKGRSKKLPQASKEGSPAQGSPGEGSAPSQGDSSSDRGSEDSEIPSSSSF